MNRHLAVICAFTLASLVCAAALLSGCGGTALPSPQTSPVSTHRDTGTIPPALLAGARPIGQGPRFQPTVTGRPTGVCAAPLGRRYRAHLEVFANNRVVLLPAGIGARAPLRLSDGRLTRAACFGEVATLDPTGTVYFRPGARVTLAGVFSAWGEPLSSSRIASFTGSGVRTYLNGVAQRGSAGALVLTPAAEIVLEIGPYVPPHRSFTFSAPPSPSLR